MIYAPTQLSDELNQIRRRAQALVHGVPADQLTRRPDPASWSVAECLAHLNVTAAVMQSLIAHAIAQGKKAEVFGQGPFKLGVKGRLFIWIAEPPPKFRVRAPKALVPAAPIDDPSQLLVTFLRAQDEWEHLWKEAQ